MRSVGKFRIVGVVAFGEKSPKFYRYTWPKRELKQDLVGLVGL